MPTTLNPLITLFPRPYTSSGVDAFSIRKRLAELQNEIEQICREDRLYKKKGRCRSGQDIVAHDQRMLRIRQILEEIAKLWRLPTR